MGRPRTETLTGKKARMAKALIGYMSSDLRNPARLAAENTRLRQRVGELEALVLRLKEENDTLAAARAEALLASAALEEMQPA
jgi:hypothetical protein